MKERLQKSNGSNASLGEGDVAGGNQVAEDSRWTPPWFPKLKISFAQLLLAPILIIYLLKVINAGLIDYSLIPLFLLLVYFTARQIQCLVFQRAQLLSLGLSASEWSGILLLRATGLFVLLAISLWPSKWHGNFFIEYLSGLREADQRLPLIANAVLVGVILTTLPVTHPAKRMVSRLRTVEQIGWYILFIAIVIVLCWNVGLVHFLVAVAVDSVVFGYPLRLYHGEIKLPENQYNHAEVTLQYFWATLPAVISSTIALVGAIAALRSKRWGWLGVVVWGVSACVAIPYCEWLVRDGWKLRFAVSEFEGYAFEIWRNFAVVELLYSIPLLVLLTAAFGASYRIVHDSTLIQKLQKLDLPIAVYLVLLVTMGVCFRDSSNFEKVQYSFALFPGVLILALVCCAKCDPSPWLLRLNRWQRILVIVLMGIPFYYYFVPNSFQFVYGDTFSLEQTEATLYLVFCTLFLLVWAILVVLRTRVPPDGKKVLAGVAIRDLYLARNLWLIPILSISMVAFVLVWSLTICEYLSLWFWQN